MLYLLDTSTFSKAIRKNASVLERMRSLATPDDIAICTIVRGEILYGIARIPHGKRRDELAQQAELLLALTECVSIPPAAADHYAQLKRSREAKGQRLEENDLWIAATAMAVQAVLVSSDHDHAAIGGLVVENWTA